MEEKKWTITFTISKEGDLKIDNTRINLSPIELIGLLETLKNSILKNEKK